MIDVERLHAYVDGQLEAEDRTAVEALAKEDRNVERQLHSIRELKRNLKRQLPEIQADAEWRRCVGRLNEIDRARRAEHFVGKYAYAMCAVLFALIVSVGLLNRSGSGRIGTNDVAMMSANLVPFSVPSKVNDWLRSRSTNARIPDNLITVTGAAEGVLNGRYCTRLNLRDRHGDMALFLFTGVSAVDGVKRMDDGFHLSGQVFQDNCVLWPSGPGQIMMLVGSREPEELRKIAVAIQRPGS